MLKPAIIDEGAIEAADKSISTKIEAIDRLIDEIDL